MSLLIQNDLEMLRGQNLTAMAGMDEAGRGALAGPVVVAAVVLDYNVPIPGLNDSKLLSAKRRNELYEQIINSAGAYHIVAIPPARIDEISILQAPQTGFLYAYKTIKDEATFALVIRGMPVSRRQRSWPKCIGIGRWSNWICKIQNMVFLPTKVTELQDITKLYPLLVPLRFTESLSD